MNDCGPEGTLAPEKAWQERSSFIHFKTFPYHHLYSRQLVSTENREKDGSDTASIHRSLTVWYEDVFHQICEELWETQGGLCTDVTAAPNQLTGSREGFLQKGR